MAEYTTPMSRPVFKLLKSHLPGPFTFLLEANNRLPKITGSKKKVIGARIPDNPIVMNILQAIDKPLATTSIHDDDEILEYTTDAELIHDRWGKLLDAVIDGGVGDLQATTVLIAPQNHGK